MKHGTSGRRSRNRGKSRRGGNKNRSRVYDSNGPEVRIRGTAHQVFDKYDALAKDAAAASNHILAQSYLQHAEHYQRIINDWDTALENGGLYPEELDALEQDVIAETALSDTKADQGQVQKSVKRKQETRELEDA